VRNPVITPAPTPATLSNEAIIAGVRSALEGVETVQGRFIQYAPDGTQTTGTYAIRRPGRVRFDYDDPVQLLIVADGTTLAIEDGELETVERVPLLETPLNIILGRKADFDKRARVTDVRQGSGLAAITVVDPEGEYEGELTMIFRIDGWELLRWQTLDGLGNLTSVVLEDTKTGVKLDPALFRLEDARDDRDRDRR
jgi:outer membrane lipoprotein-sorting protein